tara:strand:- start:684 stop:1205 length:522 start_codon:yes stop_codon:yes gene_type:complete
MIRNNLFEIPMWSLPTINFKKKKEQLTKLLKNYPEKRVGIQNFSTNRQTPRPNLIQAFSNIIEEELGLFSQQTKCDIAIDDMWSVSYKKGDYHSPHNHGSVGYAGILYLDFPEGSQPTHYIQPWNDIHNDTTMFNTLPVKEGDIVVVPKFINHFSPPHKGKKSKRIISWDMRL